jgi:hypothetical protein
MSLISWIICFFSIVRLLCTPDYSIIQEAFAALLSARNGIGSEMKFICRKKKKTAYRSSKNLLTVPEKNSLP